MKRYRISPAARDDLKQISRYIAEERQSPQGANRLRELFLDAFRLLSQRSRCEASPPLPYERPFAPTRRGRLVLLRHKRTLRA